MDRMERGWYWLRDVTRNESQILDVRWIGDDKFGGHVVQWCEWVECNEYVHNCPLHHT